MACFLVSATEAVVVTTVRKVAEKREKSADKEAVIKTEGNQTKIPMTRKLKWLEYMLWGGVILLAFEHVWHGEVTPWFPFLTAADGYGEMFYEMATVGLGMAGLVTAVWIVMCKIADCIVRRSDASETSKETNA